MNAPVGLSIRPYAGEKDLGEIVRLLNAQYAADGIQERRSVEGEAAWYARRSEHFDAARDVVLAELAGVVVGVAGQEWVDTRDGEFREYRLWGAVGVAWRAG
ncbi:hypothetical protein BH23CHL10_BH23CHL10_01570 [soil metagenome]